MKIKLSHLLPIKSNMKDVAQGSGNNGLLNNEPQKKWGVLDGSSPDSSTDRMEERSKRAPSRTGKCQNEKQERGWTMKSRSSSKFVKSEKWNELDQPLISGEEWVRAWGEDRRFFHWEKGKKMSSPDSQAYGPCSVVTGHGFSISPRSLLLLIYIPAS